MRPQTHIPARYHRGRPRNSAAALVVVLAAASLGGCSSDASGPKEDPRVPTSIVAAEGQALQAPGGTVLPEGPTVRVLDQDGDPLSGVWVSFQVTSGGGSVPVSSRQTNAAGLARVPWILGRTPGPGQELEATAGTLSVTFQATATSAVPGQTYFGRSQYTEYLPGDLPLVVSAPHGGYLKPGEIPDRGYGTTVQDRNTQELARQIRSAVFDQTGHYPHVIISRIHRIKLDPNREIVEAAQGDPEAERAWYEFQTYIEEAQAIVEETFGKGFYIDLHGHGHAIQRLELGYLLSSSDLGQSNEALSGVSFVNKSSVKALAESSGASLADLIRGPRSIGTLMEIEGIPAVPSVSQPNPSGNPYFTGGYNTARHGSRNGGQVSGVQIECNFTGVRDTEENRQAFSVALGRVLETFFPEFLEMPFGPTLGPRP